MKNHSGSIVKHKDTFAY